MENKKMWVIGGIVTAILAIGTTVGVVLKKGHVDTDQVAETMSEALSDAADAE